MKKPTGRISTLCFATGMSGQSSGRGTWWNPSVNHATTSVLPIARLATVSPNESEFQIDRAVVSGLQQSAGDYLPADELSPYCFRACAFA